MNKFKEKRTKIGSIKQRKALKIALVALVLLIFPVLIFGLVLIARLVMNGETQDLLLTSGDWLMFFGSYVGSCITLLVLYLTLKQNEKHNEEMKTSQMKTLMFQHNTQELIEIKKVTSEFISTLNPDKIEKIFSAIEKRVLYDLMMATGNNNIFDEIEKARTLILEKRDILMITSDINYAIRPCLKCEKSSKNQKSYFEKISCFNESAWGLSDIAIDGLSRLYEWSIQNNNNQYYEFLIDDLDKKRGKNGRLKIEDAKKMNSYKSKLSLENLEKEFFEIKKIFTEKIYYDHFWTLQSDAAYYLGAKEVYMKADMLGANSDSCKEIHYKKILSGCEKLAEYFKQQENKQNE